MQKNLTEGPDKVISDETSFEQRRKQLIAQWKHVQQPKTATDSNCVGVGKSINVRSVLNVCGMSIEATLATSGQHTRP